MVVFAPNEDVPVSILPIDCNVKRRRLVQEAERVKREKCPMAFAAT
jgi:hypothetical protein